MKSRPGKRSGTVSVRAFEQALETRLAAAKTHANQQKLAAARLGPNPEPKRHEVQEDESQGGRGSSGNSRGVRFGGVQGPTNPSWSSAAAANKNAPRNSAPAWVTGDDDGDAGGSDDDEAYFKALAQKAKSGKEQAPPAPKPVLKNPYGVLKSSKPTLIAPPQPSPTAAASEAKKEATTTPFLEMFAAQYKQVQGGEGGAGESDEDDEEEDSSGSEESDDSDAAQAKPPSSRKDPTPSAKANKPAPASNPTTASSDNTSNSTPSSDPSSADTSLAGLLQSSFLSLGSPSNAGSATSSSTFSAPSFSAPSFSAPTSFATSFFSPSAPSVANSAPAPSAADMTNPQQSERSVTTVAAPSFLDLFMGNPNPANNAPLPMATAAAAAPAAPAQGDSSVLALSSPFDLLRSAFGGDASGGGFQAVTAANAAQLRAANGGSVRGSNGGRAQRERTAKELAAEAVKLEQKEASRAAIAAKVAAEAKAKLDAAAAAQQDEVAARAAANAAAEAAQEASRAASDAADRAQSLALAAAAAVGKQEADVASHVQPHAALSDAALRSIALQGGRNGMKEALPNDGDGDFHRYDDDDNGGQQQHQNGEGSGDDHARMRRQLAPLLAGASSTGSGHKKVGPRQPSTQPQGTNAMVPLDGGGRRGPNTRPHGAYQRSQPSSSSYGDDNKSVRSGVSSRASTRLGSAASYSTAGGTDSDAGSNFGSQRRGGQPSVGWSRTETRLLMGLVDVEARNAREAMHGGFMWDAVAANLRQKLRQDPNLAARGLPQRRKAVDCRRRWDHCLKKAHATPKEQLTGEQKQWLVQYNDQRAWMASGGAGPTPDVRDASKEASREARRKNRKGGSGSKSKGSGLALIPEDLEVANKAEA